MLDKAYKRLREAEYYLCKVRGRKEKRFHNEPDEMEYLLNVFLNAARGVQNAARHAEGDIFRHWYLQWERLLSEDDKILLVSMINQRNESTHAGESVSATDVVWVPISRLPVNRDRGYGVVLQPPGTPEPAIGVLVMYLEVGRQTLEAEECCSRFYELLRNMLAE